MSDAHEKDAMAGRALSRRQVLLALGAMGAAVAVGARVIGVTWPNPERSISELPLRFDDVSSVAALGHAVLEADPGITRFFTELDPASFASETAWLEAVTTRARRDAEREYFTMVDGWLLPFTFAALAAMAAYVYETEQH